jgi:anti-sigma-K factor RskA
MKGSEQASDSTAYALIVEKTRLVFIGSKLPKLNEGKQFQLWLVRRQDPKVVSAGVFSPNDDSRALVNFDDQSVLTELASLVVTDEPEGGSAEPTGTHLLEAEIEKSGDRTD